MSTGTMLFNPFTGKPRHPSDIESDPKGLLVWDGEEPLRASPLVPGPWSVDRQPGGLWIAVRLNANSPGGFDRLPANGAFRTESEARAAIAKATGAAA